MGEVHTFGGHFYIQPQQSKWQAATVSRCKNGRQLGVSPGLMECLLLYDPVGDADWEGFGPTGTDEKPNACLAAWDCAIHTRLSAS